MMIHGVDMELKILTHQRTSTTKFAEFWSAFVILEATVLIYMDFIRRGSRGNVFPKIRFASDAPFFVFHD